ncbi:MAG: PEP-CTERM sorting domain-containing protein, partial [Planctomycetes bacterium]|nr:PEP-CTERM sorting domain-containing protein [Planctomycetota bacterium]
NATMVADAFVSLLSLDPPGGQEEFLQGAGSINAAGTLEPGVYRLIFQASADTNVDGDGTSSATASFELMAFDLTEIPEPATIGLLLVGVGIGVTKRRRTRVV